MNRKKRRSRRAAVAALILFSVLLALLYQFRFSPLLRAAAEYTVVNAASSALNDAVTRQLREGSVDYSGIVLLEKDVNGNITALRTDMAQIARLRAEVFEILDELVPQMTSMPVGVTLGDVLMPELFAGRGLTIPVRLLAMQMTGADFYSTYESGGINQSTQQIWMTFSVDVTYTTVLGTKHTTVSTDVMIAETVLLGQVPESYFDLA